MANLIDEIVSQKAFDELERLKRELAEAQKSIEAFYKQTGSMPKFGGAGTATSELEKMVGLTKRLTEQIQVYGSVAGKALVEAQQAKRELVNETKLLVQQEQAEEGSINQLRASLNMLTKQYESMGRAAREGLGGKELHARIMATRTEVDKLEQSLGNYKRNVGNYTNATFQLSQVFRELPAFTFSATTGIMALSNNLPMLADSFKQVSQATNETTGKVNGTMGALKIFGASIFSLGNIFTLAIAALTIFSDEIIGFFNNTTKADTGLKGFTKSLQESADSAAAEIVTMQNLYNVATDVTMSMDERTRAVKELQENYPDYLGNLSEEAILAGQAQQAYENLVDAMIDKAIYQAMQKEMEPLASSIVQMVKTRDDLIRQRDSFYGMATSQANQTDDLSKRQENYNKAIDAQNKLIDATRKQMKDGYETAKEYFNILAFGQAKGGGGKKAKKEKKEKEIDRISDLKKLYEQEKNLAEANFNLGRTSFMQYQQELIRIQEEYFRVRLSGISNLTKDEKDKQISFLNDLAKDAKEIINSMEEWVNKARNAVGSARKADMERMAKEGKDEFAKTAEESVKWFKSWLDKQPPPVIKVSIEPEPIDPEDLVKLVIDSVNKASELMKSISDATFNAEMSRFNEREKRMTDYYDEEEKRVKQSYTNKDEQEKQLTKLNARRAAEEKALEKDRALSARKRANAQKAYDIANIITTTASAIMETLETYKGTPLAYVMAGVVAATGAAQIAAAQSAPIPQFAKGTESSPEGYAVVGEKGHELVIEPSGKKWVTPAKDTITYLKKGSKVIPNDKLMTMVRDSAYVELANMNMPVTPDLYGKALIDQFDELANKVDKLSSVMSNKDMRVNIVGNFDHYMHVKRNIK